MVDTSKKNHKTTPTTSNASRGAEAPAPTPPPDQIWIHFWFSTFGTWLRGDARGFRDHDHRIHSSGDYRSPPPPSEHRGLREWTKQHMHKPPVRLDPALRERIGLVMLREFEKRGARLIALAVGSDHVHGLARMDRRRVRTLVGHAKRRSSHAIRDALPGVVWAKKCGLKTIRDRAQQVRTFHYIEKHRSEGAWVCTFRDGL